ERWDGKGPGGLRGDAIDSCACLIAIANQIELHQRSDGNQAALAMAEDRSGGWFDPVHVSAFERCAPGIFDELDRGEIWDTVLDAEPKPVARVASGRIDD